jgi:hypothetical protein
MNSTELLNMVKMDPCLRRYVKGVYASNTLPQIVTQYPSAFIVNTQPLPMSGEHWVTIIIHSPSHAEFFDSLGKSPTDYNLDIQTFLNKNSEQCNFKSIRLQPRNSDLCGLYVLVFLILRLCFKNSFNHVYGLFSKDIQSNDDFVKRLIYDYYVYH